MADSRRSRANDILNGCEDLLNDFSLPEEHRGESGGGGRAAARPNPFDSAPSTPADSSAASSSFAPSNSNKGRRRMKKPSAMMAPAEDENKKAWGTAIDRYVASVLEGQGIDDDNDDLGSPGAPSYASTYKSHRSQKTSQTSKSKNSSKSNKKGGGGQHPDSHLLAALEQLNDGRSSASSHRSVDLEGRIEDDSSFAPINPFDDDWGGVSIGSGYANKRGKKSKGAAAVGSGGDDENDAASFEKPYWRKKEWLRQYLREEWKPISLIVLVISVAIVVSVTAGGGGGGGKALGGGGGLPETPGLAVDTPDVTAADVTDPGPTPALSPNPVASVEEESPAPTYYPTYLPTGAPIVETESPVTDAPATPAPEVEIQMVNPFTTSRANTLTPTPEPTEAPTPNPTTPAPTSPPTSDPTSPPTSAPTDAPSPEPTDAPTSGPTDVPTSSPTMPAKYHEMLKAAKYVSGVGGGSPSPFDDPHSPQSVAFDWLYEHGKPSNNLYEFFEQYAVAVTVFGLAETADATAFSDGQGDVCGWEGIRCAFNYTSDMVHVTEIRMGDRGLTGTISEEIGFLPMLSRLDLSSNGIGGTVPEGVYGLTRLRHLFLNDNNLRGTISPSIDDLHMAEQIYMGQNAFTGALPQNIGTNRPNQWRFFSLHDNMLTGPIHEGMKLRNAYMLDLSKNNFYGAIPADMNHENYSTLRMLYLDHNMLTGTIPDSMMQMRKMKALFLNDNLLTGMIPWNIDDNQKLNLLTLRFQHNRLSHPVSSAICNLDVTRGDYELVELGVDCEICPDDCDLCQRKCY